MSPYTIFIYAHKISKQVILYHPYRYNLEFTEFEDDDVIVGLNVADIILSDYVKIGDFQNEWSMSR